METFNLTNIIDGLDDLEFHELGAFNEGAAGVYWTSTGTGPWEFHPDTDELLIVLDGSVVITVLGNDGEDDESMTVGAGELVIVPRGHWHRHEATEAYREFYLTPGASEHSFDDDPRTATGQGG